MVKIFANHKKLKEALSDINRNHKSHTPRKPIRVSFFYDENKLFLIDGYHRIIEATSRGETLQWEQDVVYPNVKELEKAFPEWTKNTIDIKEFVKDLPPIQSHTDEILKEISDVDQWGENYVNKK